MKGSLRKFAFFDDMSALIPIFNSCKLPFPPLLFCVLCAKYSFNIYLSVPKSAIAQRAKIDIIIKVDKT